MNTAKTAKSAAKLLQEPLEALVSHTKPKAFLEEARKEILPFLDNGIFAARPKEIAQKDLAQAGREEELGQMKEEEVKETQASLLMLKQEYTSYDAKVDAHDKSIRKEFTELQTEIAGLAKASGVDTKAHLETVPKKVGILDIRRLTSIVKFLRFKAESSKEANDMVTQRQNAKRTTGMLAWVSGKQMKIHEQGTLTLQG
jgi:hypothetical protein